MLLLEQTGFAQTVSLNLAHYLSQAPKPSASDTFRPLHLRYLSYDNQANDFKILLDKGDYEKGLSPKGTVPDGKLEQETQELMKYFFIGLALPNDKFWVNLRPDAPDNIIDDDLAKTDIGRIFLEADVQLKKYTAGLTSPQTPEGQAYWDKLYKKAGELFGTENITIPTLTRPWIVPNEIIIREAAGEASGTERVQTSRSTPDNGSTTLTTSAYIYKATLKVMLEEDYLTSRGGSRTAPTSALSSQQYEFKDPRLKELNEYSTQLIKELIIPKLTYQVNTAKRYAPLRQVYYSLILAQWFKQKYKDRDGSFKESVIFKNRPFSGRTVPKIDSGDLTNLVAKQPYDKQTYFKQYQQSFKDGEYNLQESMYTPMGQSIRRYMSGGMFLGETEKVSSAIEVVKGFNLIPRAPYLKNTVYPFSSSPLKKNESIEKNGNASLASLLRGPLNAPKDLSGKARTIIKEDAAIKEFLGVRDIKDIVYEIEQEEDFSGGYVLKFIVVDTESGKMSFYAKLRHSSGTTEEIIKRMWPEEKTKVIQSDHDGDWVRYKVDGFNNEFQAFRSNPTTLEYKMTIEASQEGIVPRSCIIADSLIVRGIDDGISLRNLFYGYGQNKGWLKFFLKNKQEIIEKIGETYGILNKKLGIVHGDIKPEHIYITKDRVYLIDFSVREPNEGGLLSRRGRSDSDLKNLISVFPDQSDKNLYEQWLKKGYDKVSSAVVNDKIRQAIDEIAKVVFNPETGQFNKDVPLEGMSSEVIIKKLVGGSRGSPAYRLSMGEEDIVVKFFPPRSNNKEEDYFNLEFKALELARGNSLFQQLITHRDPADITVGYIVTKFIHGKSFYVGTESWNFLEKGIKGIPQEHWKQLVLIYEFAEKKGISIDPHPNNFKYDKNRGFVVLDFSSSRRDFMSIIGLREDVMFIVTGFLRLQLGDDNKLLGYIKNAIAIAEKEINKERKYTGIADSTSSPSTSNDKGGIAFNALPIQTEAVASFALGSFPGVKAFQGDIEAEWGQIQAVFNAGIRPSIQRMSEYTTAAASSGLSGERIDLVRAMLADILRRDEEAQKLTSVDPALKGLLSALEAA